MMQYHTQIKLKNYTNKYRFQPLHGQNGKLVTPSCLVPLEINSNRCIQNSRNKVEISLFYVYILQAVAEDRVATVSSLSSNFSWVTEMADVTEITAATPASVAATCEFEGIETASLSLSSVNLKVFMLR